MKKYYLEELYIMGNGKFWRTIIQSEDIEQLRQLKKMYEEKDKLAVFRIMELK